jgi:hypothetical protein
LITRRRKKLSELDSVVKVDQFRTYLANREIPDRRPWLVKYDGACSSCGTTLTKGTEAIWRQRERQMLCLDCGAVQ